MVVLCMFEKKPKILIVDDEERNLRLLEISLSAMGYEIFLAMDGEEAVKRVKAVKPDLILLDVMMPRINGFDVCRMLKEAEDTRNIPVVLVTALEGRDGKLKGLECGADDFLTKPVDMVELKARVNSLLRVKRYHDQLEESYRSILNITGFCEKALKNYAPLHFNSGMEDAIVLSMLRRSEDDYDRPSQIMLCDMEGDTARCVLYGRVGGEKGILVKDSFNLPLDMVAPFAAREFYNVDDGPGPCGSEGFVHEDLGEILGAVQNFVSYCNSSFFLIAFNFLKKVDRFDVQVFKSLAVHKSFLRTIARQARDLEDSFLYTIGALARAAEANDEDTGNHITRVNQYARALAVTLSLPDYLTEIIGYSAQMHDVGKIHIHPDILRKPGPLTPEEWTVMKQHTIYGRNILGDSPRLAVAAQIAIAHHENWDGSGYPYGLKEEEIPLPARIVQVADVYDALRSRRTYKNAYSHEQAMKTMNEGDERTRPQHFDPIVLQAFNDVEHIFEKIYSEYTD
jgi:response regulator RpfG family c-di-GMP phosphodiesterase